MLKTPFSSLLAMEQEGAAYTTTLPDDWLQGRTAYGGLSAALCYEAAQKSFRDLPPLRSAQFAFVGPASGQLKVEPTLLRRGKSAAFISVDLFGDSGIAVRSLLCFGAKRQSAIDLNAMPAPIVKHWDECPAFFVGEHRPASTQHFDGRLAAGAGPRTPGADPSMHVWLTHIEASANATMPGLIALADALPPAATILFAPESAPISTMTWSLDMLTGAPESPSGWWLVRNSAQSAAHGYSSQDMAIWNDQGMPVMAMRQNIAIFA